ncbi:hypothetical protein P5673_008847 [Acropora cervicornis]|uniref:Uncharacterized protein n=1 Tax=Acropora cervicornis TaxID=6130 RepID=A0AAD9VAA6_ACRCE|nr:hypothetical protein P5673_008847 [Acropora cervicornis]
MNSTKGLFLVFCLVVIAGQVASFTKEVEKGAFRRDVPRDLNKYEDWHWMAALEKLKDLVLSRLKQCLFEAIQEGFQALRKKIRNEKEEKNKEKENKEDAGSGSATAVESPEE